MDQKPPAPPPPTEAPPTGSAHEAWRRAALRNPRIKIIEPSMTEVSAPPRGSAAEAFMKEASKNPHFKLVSPSGRGYVLAGWPNSKPQK